MHLVVDEQELRRFLKEIVVEVIGVLDWPEGRVALDEAEAAKACGVNKHVLRDLRLAGKFEFRRMGRKTVYTRLDLLRGLENLKLTPRKG